MSTRSPGPFGRMGRIRRPVAALLVVAFGSLALAGCYGRFPLTRIVYRANGSVEDAFVRQLVFWGFLILPVYSGATFIDAVALNLIEFWTGELVIDDARVEMPGGRAVFLAGSEDGSELLLTVEGGTETVGELRFVKAPDGTCTVRDACGAVVGSVAVSPEGQLTLTDADGEVALLSGDGSLLAAYSLGQ
jgi:hypothetical protein